MSNLTSKIAREVVEKYNTSEPFEIAERLNIIIEFAPLKKHKAVYVNVYDTQIIVVSEKYKYSPQLRFMVAHELFHALHHSDTVFFYRHGYNVRMKQEREANQFATYLCLSGATFYEGQTNHNVLMEYGIPYDMQRYIRSV